MLSFLQKSQNRKVKEIVEDVFHPYYQFWYDTSSVVKYIFDRDYDGVTKKDDFISQIIEDNASHDDIIQTSFLSGVWMNKFITKDMKRNNNVKKAMLKTQSDEYPTLTHIILTLENNDLPEYENICRLQNYRKDRFKDVKNVWVYEKHSAKSERYHIHIVAEGYWHPTKNLKPRKTYNGYIKCVPLKYNRGIVEEYFTKENEPQGDIEYIQKLIEELPK